MVECMEPRQGVTLFDCTGTPINAGNPLPVNAVIVGDECCCDIAEMEEGEVVLETPGDDQIAAADADRQSLTIRNHTSTKTIFVRGGGGAATTAASFPVPPGTAISIGKSDGAELEWRGISEDATPSEVRFMGASCSPS